MNALANDQLGRLRDLIRDSGTSVTFALYTGDSETVGRTLGEPVAGNELTRRDDIRRNPPDIILTNYKQLEFLLVRKVDRALFTSALRYLVQDEIHSYRGALATEVACLLRRLKARCGLRPGELRCIGTSATVSQDAGGDTALARFATDLFAERCDQEDVIGEVYRALPTVVRSYLPPLIELTDDEVGFFSHGDESALLRLSERLCGRPIPAAGTTHDKLRAMPYRAGACYATPNCSGQATDLKAAQADFGNYYVDLYTADRPRRLKALEHTAQIDQETRAMREQEFKEGRVEALVCSPTLELGVNIGDLYSVLMRNAPPTPANYIQRAGRAGRRLRIGFVSTFCGVGPHDRHCFEDPAWLVRGEFRPPLVRLANDKIVARHVRSFALEELNEDFSWLMGDLLEDVQNPAVLKKDRCQPLLDGLRQRAPDTLRKAQEVFGAERAVAETVASFPDAIEATVQDWHRQVVRLHKEFQHYAKIVPTRESEQKRRARLRAYGELTTDREKAFALTYLADVGLLPAYQFPTDTFALDPGVGDTPTLRRPAWIALFEFAPGNMVYANGHKLKSIRVFFEGGHRSAAVERGSDQSGRVEPFCFCDHCGFATRETVNNCPSCGSALRNRAEVALIDAFEAEENTQITSAEDSRQRLNFERREHLLADQTGAVTIYPYEFVALEFRPRAELLVTNWGRQARWGGQGEKFELCPSCGRHRPHGLVDRALARWDEEHHRFCDGAPRFYILGYAFSADVLVVPCLRGSHRLAKKKPTPFVEPWGRRWSSGRRRLLSSTLTRSLTFRTRTARAAGHWCSTRPRREAPGTFSSWRPIFGDGLPPPTTGSTVTTANVRATGV